MNREVKDRDGAAVDPREGHECVHGLKLKEVGFQVHHISFGASTKPYCWRSTPSDSDTLAPT